MRMTYSTLTSRVCEQARLARESGCTMNEATAILAQQEARDADQHALRYEGTASVLALSTGQQYATEADVLSAGTGYVRAWHTSNADQRKRNVWNTIGHIESDQPYAQLFALAHAQYLTVNGIEGALQVNRYGRPMKLGESRKRSEAGRKGGRPVKASSGQAMSQAERTALSRWRSKARQEGFVCAEHGPSLKGCSTECRQAALNLTSAPAPIAVAESADRGW